MTEEEGTEPCPRCGTSVTTLIPIDAGMRLALKQSQGGGEIPAQVCSTCFEGLTGSVSQGIRLRMEREAKEKNKMVAWKNRVHLIKNARTLMSSKAYSEAAVQYEKYLRVLEVVYNLKPGELNPTIFNNSTRSKEMTVIASVYWDLLRIYDTSPRYGDRMMKAAIKLAEFLPFSTIYPDIVKKADQFAKTAKNPQVVRTLLRSIKSQRGPCFVASAAFAGEPHAQEVLILRRFRDVVLRPHALGRRAIYLYYKLSPPLARWIGTSQRKSFLTRWCLTKIARLLRKSLKSV